MKNTNHINSRVGIKTVEKDMSEVQYFVYCSGKTGSKSIVLSLSRRFGHKRCLHVHGTNHFSDGHGSDKDLKKIIIENSKNFSKIYVIDSYREPIERGISSFFQNINTHCPDWKEMTTDELIEFFNQNKLYLLELYHSYLESWGSFNISTDVEFDFERGYIIRNYENIIFVKTRLKESSRWSEIFSEILQEKLTIRYENDSANKEYFSAYKDFLKKYKLPSHLRENILNLFNNTETSSQNNTFLLNWVEMKKFMKPDEIEHYIEKWCKN